jgi:hypothetical protein
MGVSVEIVSPSRNGEVTGVQSQDASSGIADGGEKGVVAVEAVISEPQEDQQAGVSTIEAAQAIWGKKGFYIILFG